MSKVAILVERIKRLKGPLAAIAAGGAVVGGLAGYWNGYHVMNQAVGEKFGTTSSAKSTIPADAGPLSILVLPFANQTGDANKAYIADALTSSISADLNRIRDAYVVPVATAFTYKDKNLTLAQVAKDAGVHFVLQGSVVASGDKLRISAQLADTQSGKQLWNETFEGEASKLFELQDLVTARIGNSIGNEMVIVAARESEKRKSSPKVADMLLQVRALWIQPDSLENYRATEKLLRQILLLEPNHADAIVRLAVILDLQVFNFHQEIDEGTQKKLSVESGQLSLRAQALDPNNPAVYPPLSHNYLRNGDRDAAGKALERLLELAPRSPLSYNELGAFLFDEDPARAVEVLQQGLKLTNPNVPHMLYSNLGRAYFNMGEYRQAIDTANRCIQNQPRYVSCLEPKVWSYALLGEKEQAQAAVTELLRVDPQYRFTTDAVNFRNPTSKQRANDKKQTLAAKLAGLP